MRWKPTAIATCPLSVAIFWEIVLREKVLGKWLREKAKDVLVMKAVNGRSLLSQLLGKTNYERECRSSVMNL